MGKNKEKHATTYRPSQPLICFSVISLVDSSRKSVTHPVEVPSPHRPVVQTEEAEDSSMLQTGPRKALENIIPLQDRTKTGPPQGPSQQEASLSQGRVVFIFKVVYSHCRSLVFLKSV